MAADLHLNLPNKESHFSLKNMDTMDTHVARDEGTGECVIKNNFDWSETDAVKRQHTFLDAEAIT